MANDEHVALLKKGVAAWNEWRRQNPWPAADLSGANLSGANLNGADLTEALLVDTVFGATTLSEVKGLDRRLSDREELWSAPHRVPARRGPSRQPD
jgi:uncharacterized protein YjbI with pentapeptide repeats